jgi:hypothetical protein
MEKIYTNSKLGNAWQKEARSRTGDMWWFDFDDYGREMKLDGESPIICNEEEIEEPDCWNTLNGSTCMLLLRNGVKTVVAVVHEKGGGLRLYSKEKTSFKKSDLIKEDYPGVFLLLVDWKTYAKLGLIKSAKKYFHGAFKPEVVFVDPKVGTLVDWNIDWMMERSLKKLGAKRVQDILKGGGLNV